VNRVADALSQRAHIFLVIPLQMNIHENILTITTWHDWYKEVKENIRQNTMLVPKFEGFTMENDELMRCNNRICVLPNDELKSFILNEAHRTM
jgi:hypothetical protein